MPLVFYYWSAKFTERSAAVVTILDWSVHLYLPLYNVVCTCKGLFCYRRMTLMLFRQLGSVVQVLVALVGTSHFGMIFVATTSAIFYVVIDTAC